MVRRSTKTKSSQTRGQKKQRKVTRLHNIPDEFLLKGETTRHHIMAGEPRKPGACAEYLGVMDAWQKEFGEFPDKAFVDKERIKVKFAQAWFWGPPTEQQIKNLTALDDTKRHELVPHQWEVLFIRKEDVIPMSEETKRKLKEYDDNRQEKSHEPTHRERIDGLTRMVPNKKSQENHAA